MRYRLEGHGFTFRPDGSRGVLPEWPELGTRYIYEDRDATSPPERWLRDALAEYLHETIGGLGIARFGHPSADWYFALAPGNRDESMGAIRGGTCDPPGKRLRATDPR